MRQNLFLAASVAALMAAPALAQDTTTEDTAAGAATDAVGDAAGAAADTAGDAAAAVGDAATDAADAAADATTTTGGETVTTTGGDTAAATGDTAVSGDPMQALAGAAQRLNEVARQMQGGIMIDGMAPSTAAPTTTTIDGAAATTETVEATGDVQAGTGDAEQMAQQMQQDATQALDDLDAALTQAGTEGDQAMQDQVASLQQQSADVRQQLQADPANAGDEMEALAQAALQLQTAGIPAEADAIVGRTVVSMDGEEAGEVVNLLVTPDGEVTGLVLRRSGALGLGGTQFAVTWDQISIQGVQYMVNMTREQVEALPEYRTE